jgi:hypothetical protein
LNQLIDIIQEDISGSATRRKYQVFVTGGVGPGVTSSLFQTVYDQDFSLQTANPIFDMSVGLFQGGTTVTTAPGYSVDTTGKLLFASQSMMMREKVDVYRQFASYLLGNADHAFYLGATSYPNNSGVSTTTTARIDNALFLNVKRLFARDKVRKETFAMRFYQSASLCGSVREKDVDEAVAGTAALALTLTGSNVGNTGLTPTSEYGVEIFADVGANSDTRNSSAGDVARIKQASDTTQTMGLLFYDVGIIVLDMATACWADQPMYGIVDAMNDTQFAHVSDHHTQDGKHPGQPGAATTHTETMPTLGTVLQGQAVIGDTTCAGNLSASFIPDFLVSGSIDNILDHIAATRFSSGTLTAKAFQNQTTIQSTIYFCRAAPGEFNYSSNPTFIDSSGNLNVIEDNTDATERSFTFMTTIGLYGPGMDLLAVGKLSRPVEKNDEKDLTIRIRLDF